VPATPANITTPRRTDQELPGQQLDQLKLSGIGHITFDAALLLGYFLSFWQSPLFNYEKIALVVTPHSVNVTTWGPYIPGWDSPHPQDQPETLLGLSGAGFITLMTWMWIQAWLTARITRHFPDWTWNQLLPAKRSG
jgi:hypothetical protein